MISTPTNIQLKKDGLTLACIKKPLQTNEMCMAAVSNNGMALVHVKNKTKEICIAAVANNPEAAKHVDKKYRSLFGGLVGRLVGKDDREE